MYSGAFNDLDLTSLHHYIKAEECVHLCCFKPSRIANYPNNNRAITTKDSPTRLPTIFKACFGFVHGNKVTQSAVKTVSEVELVERLEVDWLICLFNHVFYDQNVTLVRGNEEPEYFPATQGRPAQLVFAHGFLSSALHELSHWTIAGAHRRTLPDFGYSYVPDGRSKQQQQFFEQVEIKPQAIECLFTLMLRKSFKVSNDNLNAKYDSINHTFETNVLRQVQSYLAIPTTLPNDAKIILTIFSHLCHHT